MPLSIEERKRFLQENGYDPNTHSYDEDTGNIYQGADTADIVRAQTGVQQGRPEPALTPPASSTSALKTFVKSAATELGPTGVALGAGALASRAVSRIPFAGIPVGLGVSYLAGKYSKELQDYLVPESVKQNLYPTEQEVTQHPYANLGGRIAAAAPFINPIESIKSLGRAGKDLGRLITSPAESYAALAPEELAALKQVAANTGINVGAQAGINTAQQLASGQPFDYGQLARESALGLVLNEPTKLGQKYLGMRPSYEGVPTRAERVAANAQEFAPTEIATEPTFSYKPQAATESIAKPPPLPIEEVTPAKAPQVRGAAEVQAEMKKVNNSLRENLEKLSATKEPQYQELVNALGQRADALKEELRLAKHNAVQPAEAPKQLFKGGLGQGSYKFAEGEAPGGQQSLEQDIQNLFAKRGIRPGQYKVQITDASGKPILGRTTGKSILGQAIYPSRTVHLSTEASKAIPYHEAGHIYFEDLARSGDKRDRALVQRVLKELGHPESVDEYVALNDKAQAGDESAQQRLREIEEPLMDFAGLEGAQRAEAKGAQKFKQWFKDYLSRFGGGEEPAKQQFSARLEHEVPYGARQELTKGNNEVNYAANQISQQGSIQRERREGDRLGEETQPSPSNSLLKQEEGGGQGQGLQEGGGQGQGHDVGKAAEVSGRTPDIIKQQIEDIKKKIASIEEYKTRAPKNKYLDSSIQGFKEKISNLEEELKSRPAEGKNAEEEPKYKQTYSNADVGKYTLITQRISPFFKTRAEAETFLESQMKGPTYRDLYVQKSPFEDNKYMVIEVHKNEAVAKNAEEEFYSPERKKRIDKVLPVVERQTNDFAIHIINKFNQLAKDFNNPIRFETDGKGEIYYTYNDVKYKLPPQKFLEEQGLYNILWDKANFKSQEEANQAYYKIGRILSEFKGDGSDINRYYELKDKLDYAKKGLENPNQNIAKNAEEEKSITPKQDVILKNFYKAANQVALRTSYGQREGEVKSPGFVATWSNGSKEWNINPNKPKIGQQLKLDANQIFIRGTNLANTKLIAQHLPELPLDKFSFENSPLNQALKGTNKSQDKIIQELAEFWNQEPKSTDVIEATSRFMDKLRSPEQTQPSGKNAEKEPFKGMEKQLQGAAFEAEKDANKAKTEKLNFEESKYQAQDALATKLGEALKKYRPQIGELDKAFLVNEVNEIRDNPNAERLYRQRLGDEIIDEIKNSSDVVEQQLKEGKKDTEAEFENAKDKAVAKSQELEAYQHPMQEGPPEARMFGKNSEIFTSTVDRIASKGDETHKKVATKMRNFFDTADTNYGRYGQSVVRLFLRYKQPEVENVYRREWEKANNQPFSRQLNATEQRLDNELQPLLRAPENDARRLGAKDIPSRFNIIDPNILWKIDNEPTSIDAKRSLRQWEDWIVKQGASRADAKEALSDWQKLHRNHGNIEGSKIEQYGLPWELIDKNPAQAALSFGRRTGLRLSWVEHMRNNPEMQAALGIKDVNGKAPVLGSVPGIDYIGHEKAVQDALKFAYNIQAPESPRLQAWARATGSLVMGPGTAARNIASIPANLAPYDVTMSNFMKGLSNIKDATQRAYETGATRLHPGEYEYLGDIGNPDKLIAGLNKASSFLRKWTGRDASDRFESNLYYSIGEQWAGSQLVKARNGDTKAQNLLKRMTGVENYSTLSIPEIAKGFVNVVRGTYGPQGLPPWMLSGNLAPFVALNKYSVEKWANVYKDVFKPMKNGNIGPFLKYTLTAVGLTGPLIEQLNELLSGHKGSDLNIKEAMAAYAETKDPELIASKLIGLAQLSGYAGVAGDLAKLGTKTAEGKSLVYNNPLSFPLYTLASQTIAQNVSGLVGAINSGEDPIDVFGEFVKDLATQSSQTGRYISGHIPSEENTRKSEYQDIRKYEEATGRRENTELGQSNPNKYIGLSTRNFKQTSDVGEAIGELPGLIQKAFDKAGNDPYRLKAEFNKIKQNSYRTMPSMKDQPLEFFSYLKYLRDTQGDEVASQRLSRFLTQGAINRAKASIVP